MNEFYEAVSNLFEELRCDFGEREYTVQHYGEEQRAYYQGMMDVVEFLINIGAIKKSTNVKRMIEKYAR